MSDLCETIVSDLDGRNIMSDFEKALLEILADVWNRWTSADEALDEIMSMIEKG
jgi:hypothetical protein